MAESEKLHEKANHLYALLPILEKVREFLLEEAKVARFNAQLQEHAERRREKDTAS